MTKKIEIYKYENKLGSIFNKYLGRNNFIDYYQALDFGYEIDDFINNDSNVTTAYIAENICLLAGKIIDCLIHFIIINYGN